MPQEEMQEQTWDPESHQTAPDGMDSSLHLSLGNLAREYKSCPGSDGHATELQPQRQQQRPFPFDEFGVWR